MSKIGEAAKEDCETGNRSYDNTDSLSTYLGECQFAPLQRTVRIVFDLYILWAPFGDAKSMLEILFETLVENLLVIPRESESRAVLAVAN